MTPSVPKREHARALILTSNGAVRRILRSYLLKDTGYDFSITEESKVRQGLEAYHKTSYDLVLLGESVEGDSPMSFLHGIYQSPEQWHPVIFVHFSQDHEVCLEALRSGAKEYVELGSLSSSELSFVANRIRETLRLYRENRRVIEELGRSNEELSQFAYVISHDLKEPLRKISSFGELLREKLKVCPDEEASHYVDRMVDAASRMGSMMSALLEYSKVARSFKADCWSSIADAIHVAQDALEVRLRETGGCVKIVGDFPRVNCEALRLEQLFLNLIGNGLKYYREGIAPIISLSCEKHDDGVRFRVQDNGIGFKQDQAEGIFAIFQRLHARHSKFEGHGVGLAICKRIVESMDGKIWAEGELGVGASFYFEIPAASVDWESN